MSTTVTKKNSGNKTTEIIIGSGAAKMATVLTGMNSVMEIMSKLPETIQQTTLEVTNLEDKIGVLTQEYANKLVQNKIDLKNAYDTDKKAFVEAYCASNGVILVVEDDYNEMKTSLEIATENVEETVAKEVAKAIGMEKANSANAMKIATLEHEKKEAANTAEINQLKNQNKFLEEQLNNWKTMFDKQIAAETERAKYGQISTLNVGGTTQGR